MGTVTSLLVLAALLTSINACLPRTSYFKYIDLWFSWYLANIFSFVIFHIVLNLDHSSPKHAASTIQNGLAITQLPLKIQIGVKTVMHSTEENSVISEKVSGKDLSIKEESTDYKYRMNKKAIIFFPVLIVCFNVSYFVATTHVF